MVVSENSIWDIAVTDARSKKTGQDDKTFDPQQSTLVFIGNRSAGKTTLIQRFLDRDELPKSTLALEYTYARRSGKAMAKDVCHIWELGGGGAFCNLLATPITHRTIFSLSVILTLDLSRPETIWIHLALLLNEIKDRVDRVLRSTTKEEQKQLQEKLLDVAWAKYGKDHPDRNVISPSLVPIVIVGGKYDIFQDMDSESKKLICRALRFMAHTHGASLLFFSTRDSGLIKRAKELLSHHGFGTPEIKSISQDYNKPLIIPAGSDSLTFIGGMTDSESSSMTSDFWKRMFTIKFPQEEITKTALPVDPSSDSNYAETDVDNLRAQKDQELERLRREVNIEARPKSTRKH